MHWFYSNHIQAPYIRLMDEEALHCAKVLRLKAGSEVAVVDGSGNYYLSKLITVDIKNCTAEIIATTHDFNPLPIHLHVACAPTKNMDRFEWFIEKATEIGISEITPLLCEHSERKQIKTDRLQRLMIAAMKQSQKASLPILHEMVSLKAFISQKHKEQKFIAYCGEEDKKPFQKMIEKGKDLLILIGPEGDFSSEEVSLCLQNGFIPVTLGNQRLRTETAALAACHTVTLVNEFFI